MGEIKLNKNDDKLLGFCLDNRRSVGEIAKALNISPASVSFRVKRLKELNLINLDKKGRGKKTYVRTIGGDKTKEYFIYLLKELKRKKEMSEMEFLSLLPFDFTDPKSQDKFSAPLKLFTYSPPLVKKIIRLTPEGEAFLRKETLKDKIKNESKS